MKILVSALILVVVLEAIFIFWLMRNEKKEKNIDEMIQFFRDLWGKFVFYVLATSIIGLFLGSIFFKEIIGLDEINTWVGIVLGLVALVIGVISLFLSFYNVDQANKTQEKTVEIIQGFRDDMIEHMHDMQSDVERKIEESSEKTRNEIAKFMYELHNLDFNKDEVFNTRNIGLKLSDFLDELLNLHLSEDDIKFWKESKIDDSCNNLVHGDLNPSNVLLDDNNNGVILNLGEAVLTYKDKKLELSKNEFKRSGDIRSVFS